jgi:spermidine/putrescine transport system ATP-binding protein
VESAAVELRKVTKRFGDVVAVDGISLRVHDGEFFSMLGPSGCGKTTTLRMIAGFEQPSEGDLFVVGQSVAGVPAFERNTNMVFQNYALFPHMSVAQNVAFGLEMKRVPRAEIDRRVGEALEMVRLPGMKDRRPNQLSGGQQQRVALARALINHPAVLLLDEPLGALDLKLRKEMQLELKDLQQRVGITFVYVTHDQEEALTMSDRIAVMHLGSVLQVGTPTEIYERPNCRFVADFIGETNFLEGEIVGQENEYVTVMVRPDLKVHVPVGEQGITDRKVTVAIRPEKLHLLNEPRPQALEGAARPATLPEPTRTCGEAGEAPCGSVGSAVRAGEPVENCLPGVIREVVYIGTDTHFVIRLADDLTIRVREQNRISAADRRAHFGGRGDQVYVAWAPESALLLTA